MKVLPKIAWMLMMLPSFGLADQSSSVQLHTLFDEERAFAYQEDPLQASQEGVSTYDDRLPSCLASDYERQLMMDKRLLDKIRMIDSARLTGDDLLSYRLFEHMLQNRIKLASYKPWRMPLTADEGFHSFVLQMHEYADTRSAKGYERYIARLKDVRRYFDENIRNMKLGLKDGFTLPSLVVPGLLNAVAAEQVLKSEESPLFKPFLTFLSSIPVSEQERLKKEGREAIATFVMPAYRDFYDFLKQEYAPGCRKTLGALDLPDGKKYYQDLVRYFASFDVDPDHIHELGLKEVARIQKEMNLIMSETKFKGDFKAFLNFLKTDTRFYEKTPLALLKTAAYLAKEIDGKLPQFFGKLPRMTYRVEAVPAELAPNYTTGRYNPGPDDGRTPGTYWVNTYALDKRPLYALPSLTLHEAVPGHHLQGALARELKDLPVFRRNLYIDAFGEGWGLYSEKLGVEMGIYKTPYENFGRLSFEMWRACRLVVDTGIHSKGWSRDRAMSFLRDHTALPEHEIQTETDRYISWPGQALSYKLGELKIWELRHRAQQELGERFDLRAFHDAVLAHGSVTMDMLKEQIDSFIAGAK